MAHEKLAIYAAAREEMTMRHIVGLRCCVCETSDERTLVEVELEGGGRATLCGSHAIMHGRSNQEARSADDLRDLLRDRRARSERRHEGDELGTALTTAFNSDRRTADRRRA
jgi:hypothetical protein